jgi:hypothetical protein
MCAIRVHVPSTGQPIDTIENYAAAILDPDGQVHYLDNLISPDEPWEIFIARRINNRGQILGIGIKDGVRIARPFLLNPNATLTGYDVIDLGVDGVSGSADALNEQGDALLKLSEGPNGPQVIRLDDGTWLPVGLNGNRYSGFSSTQMLFGRYADGLFPANRYLKADVFENLYPLQFYASNAYNHENTFFTENGYSAALERVPEVKIKGAYKRVDYFVTHDPWGNVAKIDLPPSIPPGWWAMPNSQLVGGVPLVVGNVLSNLSLYWIRFPGYSACLFRDLMAPTEQQQYDDFLPTLYDSTCLTTPRNEDGSINHAGAPMMFGMAVPVGNEEGLSRFEGIYILSPASN